MAQKIEEFDVKKEYGDLALSKTSDFISKYNVKVNGLSDSEAYENQKNMEQIK